MPFTLEQVETVANSVLDFHQRGAAKYQTEQDVPLWKDLQANQKTFPAGKDNITLPVSGNNEVYGQGYTGDDDVDYSDPAATKRASYPWRERHWGIKVTMTDLKREGISVVDSAQGKNTVEHSDRELAVLTGMFEDKLRALDRGYDKDMDLMLWKDGTGGSYDVPGIRSIIVNDPTAAAAVGGIDQSTVTYWRNRFSLGLSVTTPSDMVITNKLETEWLQLRRFGAPKHKLYAGSAFIEAVQKELRAKGLVTQSGWMSNGSTDAGMAEVSFKGKPIVYAPTLDDLSLQKYLFVLDMNAIRLRPMEGEEKKRHNPARPETKYVLYRAMTWTGGLVCDQRNTSGVYSIV